MKTIGLLGGMSWESTIPYYRHINEAVKARLGGLHSAKIVLYSVDFAEIERLQHRGDWDAAGAMLAVAAQALERAGADFIVLCTNTMHKVAPAIEAAVATPLLHIADPTAAAIRKAGLSRIGLLGTRFTTEQDFYRGRLAGRHSIEVLVPDQDDRDVVHRVIYEELCLGRVEDSLSRRDATPRRARRPRHHPGLHRDLDAGGRAGRERSAVRYHSDSCGDSGRAGVDGHELSAPRKTCVNFGCLRSLASKTHSMGSSAAISTHQ